jgi:hypothetical protein
MKAISLVLSLLISAATVFAQVDEAREAIDRGEYVRAVNLLSAELADRPTADTFLYLGIAYRHMKEYQKAEDVFHEGMMRFPRDIRFPTELANLFIENNDIDSAKAELQHVLTIEPTNNYASDELATIDMSRGDVQAALRSWNKSGRPFINDILHNYYLNFGSWVVRDGVTFHPSAPLLYKQWKTTEARLLQTDDFSNVGLEVEPTRVPDQYNAVVRTTSRLNTLPDFLFNIIKGAPVQIAYVDVWNIQNTGMNFNGNYRWDANRRRAAGGFKIPLPNTGLLNLEFGQLWRSENWDLSSVIEPNLLPDAKFLYKATALGGYITQIPTYRVQWGAGFVYRNRAARGNIPQMALNNLNVGRFSADLSLRLADRNYQNRLRLEGFAARPSIIGNIRYSGGVAELNNRYTFSKDSRTYFDWTLKGGTIRGPVVPIEDYFLLGMDYSPMNLMRGHVAAHDGKYSRGPLGTDFVLANTDIERKIATIPFFNTLNIPYITVKWELFLDSGKTWDRNHVVQPSKLLFDTGGGLRLETPTHSFNLVYGRNLREGRNVFFGYYERRLW